MTDSPPTIHKRSSHRIISKLAYLLSARWVREALQGVFLIVLARMSSTTYGEFMLALNVGQVLLFVVEFGLDQHLVPQLAQKKNRQGEVLMQFTMLKVILLFAGMIGMLLFVHWQGYAPSLRILVLVIGTGVGLEAVASSFFVACQMQGRQDLEGKLKSLGATAGFGYGIGALYLGALPLIVAFFKLIETLVNMAGSMLIVLRQSRLRFAVPDLRSIYATGRGSLVFTLMAVATILYGKANLFFLQSHAGAEAVAQYGVTWQLVDGMSSITSNVLLRNILYPLFVNLWQSDRTELSAVAENAARWLLAVAMPLMFVLYVESDRIIPLLYGSGYSDAVWMQKILVPTIGISFIHNLAAYLMLTSGRERLLLGFYVAGLVFNLMLCLTLIPGSPLMGTVLAIVLTKGVVAVMTVYTCQVSLRILQRRSMLHLGAALVLGAAAYWLAGKFVFRELAEALAVVPTLVLGYRWWKEFSGRPRPASEAA